MFFHISLTVPLTSISSLTNSPTSQDTKQSKLPRVFLVFVTGKEDNSINTSITLFSSSSLLLSTFRIQKTLFSLQQTLQTSLMAANTSSNKFDIGKKPMAYTILPSETEEGRDYVPESPMDKEKISIWKKQVLIRFTLSGKLSAFLGPYPTDKTQPEKVKNFFPCYPVTMPSASNNYLLTYPLWKHLCASFDLRLLPKGKSILLGSIKSRGKDKNNGKT